MKLKHTILIALVLGITLRAATHAQTPELVVQTGHLSVITAVAFSPDGKMLASSSVDRTIKLWDVTTGKQLRTLTGPTLLAYALAFSPDGKILASGGGPDLTVKLWDVTTGKELRALAGHSKAITSAVFSPDGKQMASASLDGTVRVWNYLTGEELHLLAGHSAGVTRVAFSRDGRTLASASEDKTIKLWDAATGKERRTFSGHTATVNSVAFSPDGQVIASGSEDSTIRIWSVENGAELRTFSSEAGGIFKVAFLADGSALMSGCMSAIRVWDTATGKGRRAISKRNLGAYCIDLSPDGKTLASGGMDQAIGLWDVTTLEPLATLSGHSTHGVKSIAFSPDGKTLANTTLESTRLWDLSTGRNSHVLTYPVGLSIYTAVFSPDSKVLATGSKFDKLFAGFPESVKKATGIVEEFSSVKLWDVATGQVLRTLKGHSDGIISLAFSPDGRLLASGSLDKTIKLWDVATGQALRTLTGHLDSISTLAFRPDGSLLASGSQDQTIKFWNPATGSEIRTLSGQPAAINAIAFSPDGKTLASGTPETLALWDVETGKERTPAVRYEGVVNAVAFSPDGKQLASGGFNKTIHVWDTASGAELRVLAGHTDMITSLAFTPRGSMLASGSFDANIKLWDAPTGKNIASLIALDAKDWIVASPEGLFDGSPATWNNILWRFGGNTFDVAPVEIFFNEFYYPGLLADLFTSRRPAAPRQMSQLDRRQPDVKLALANRQAISGASLSTRTVEVAIEVAEAPAGPTQTEGSGVRDVRLFRNGLLVKAWHGEAVRRAKDIVVFKATLTLMAGENRLMAYAFNRDNIKSADATLVVKGAESLKRAGTAYILAVGINEYANPEFNLKYAVPDATAFAQGLKQQQKMLGTFDHVEIISLLDRQATKANILRALDRFAGKDTEPLNANNPLSRIATAQPEDMVVIYFASHGKAERNRFYIIPHDLGYKGSAGEMDEAALQTLLARSVSDVELEKALDRVDAGRLAIIIDACNSGQALESTEKRRGPMNSKGLAQLAYEKGMYILTAAQGYQAALEAEKFGHGYLTYALIEEGLKTGVADTAPRDGRITIQEWLDYATERVPQMQRETMKTARGLKVVFVDGEDKIADADKRSLQQPRVFYRSEIEANSFIVAKPEAYRTRP